MTTSTSRPVTVTAEELTAGNEDAVLALVGADLISVTDGRIWAAMPHGPQEIMPGWHVVRYADGTLGIASPEAWAQYGFAG